MVQTVEAGSTPPHASRWQLDFKICVVQAPAPRPTPGASRRPAVEARQHHHDHERIPRRREDRVDAAGLSTSIDRGKFRQQAPAVDGDVAELGAPAAARLLRESEGLMDVLVNPGRPARRCPAAGSTSQRLYIIFAGKHHHCAIEVLSSEAMARLTSTKMASRYPDRDRPMCCAASALDDRVGARRRHTSYTTWSSCEPTGPRTDGSQAPSTPLEDCSVVMTMLNKARRTDVGPIHATMTTIVTPMTRMQRPAAGSVCGGRGLKAAEGPAMRGGSAQRAPVCRDPHGGEHVRLD